MFLDHCCVLLPKPFSNNSKNLHNESPSAFFVRRCKEEDEEVIRLPTCSVLEHKWHNGKTLCRTLGGGGGGGGGGSWRDV